jgi:hypothetical protein
MAGHLLSDALLKQVEDAVRSYLQRYTSIYRQPVPPPPSTDLVHLAKSTSGISKGSEGDMTVYFRNSSGTPTISSPAITLTDVRAEMGAYTANKLAYVKVIGGKWCIIMTECAS